MSMLKNNEESSTCSPLTLLKQQNKEENKGLFDKSYLYELDLNDIEVFEIV